jgi:hypothetical protein
VLLRRQAWVGRDACFLVRLAGKFLPRRIGCGAAMNAGGDVRALSVAYAETASGSDYRPPHAALLETDEAGFKYRMP